MILQEALKRLRLELGYSQTELAHALQVSFATINRWENGRVVPNERVARSVVQMVEKMDVTPSCAEYVKKAFFPEHGQEEEKVRRLDMNMAGQLIDDSSNGVFVMDCDTFELLYLNRTMEKMRARSGIEKAGMTCYGYLHGLDAPCADCKARGCLSHDKTDEFVEREFVSLTGHHYLSKGKHILWEGKKAFVQYISDESDLLEKRLAIVSEEKTNREKILEERLKLEHQRLQNKEEGLLLYFIANLSKNMVLEYGGQHDSQAETCKTLDSLIGRGLEVIQNTADFQDYRLVHDRENLLEAYGQGITERKFETQLRDSDGKVIGVRAVLHLLDAPRTGDVLLYEAVYNIDTEKTAEKFLETVLRDDYDAVGSLNISDGQYRTLEIDSETEKPKAEIISYEDMVEEYAEDFVYPEDRKYCREKSGIETVLEGARHQDSFTVRVVLEDGIHYMRHKASLIDKKRNVCLLTRKDVTEQVLEEVEKREKLQETLRASENARLAKSSFLSRMSHDMRTPMNTILGLISLMQDDVTNAQAVNMNLEKMKAASDYMLTMINDILDRSMIESGSLVLKKEPYSYMQFLAGLRNYFEPLCQKKGIQFKFEKVTTATIVETDHQRLNQIFYAILSNAVKYTEPGGTVSYHTENLTVERGRISCDYYIQDTGVGMSGEFQKHMFDFFSQGDTSITQEENGAGFGLGNAKRLVEAMGGTLQVKSKKGIGTTVIIHLSFHTLNEENLEEEVKPEILDLEELAGRNILLVEDHPLNATITSKLLEKKDVHVVQAENGEFAVEIFQKSKPHYFDAVLMDIRMPVMDGLEAAKNIRHLDREDAKDVPIIAMTANAYDEDREKSREAGMDAHLAKPVKPEVLYETLCTWMKKQREPM